VPGDVGQARGPEMEAGMEPSLGTISSNRYKVQKGVPGHSLPAAVIGSLAGASLSSAGRSGQGLSGGLPDTSPRHTSQTHVRVRGT